MFAPYGSRRRRLDKPIRCAGHPTIEIARAIVWGSGMTCVLVGCGSPLPWWGLFGCAMYGAGFTVAVLLDL